MKRLRVILVAILLGLWTTSVNAFEVERVISKGGIEAWLIRDHRNPIITLNFTFRGGSALDPAGMEGLADLTSSLLDEGAGSLDSKAFQQTLEDKAIRLSFDAGRDSFGGHLQTLTRNRDEAFELLRSALTEPRFDDEPMERIRAQVLVSLKQEKENPRTIASRILFETLYPNHPYGRPTQGTESSVAKITANDMRAFIKRRLARDNLLVGVVGDVDPEMLGKLLDNTFGSLPAKAASWELKEVKAVTTGRTIVADKNVPQSTIVFADQGMKRKDPDFYAAYVMNRILGGGGFTSRLYSEVREKRGLAYSVYASLYPFDVSAVTIGGAGTANARVGETLQVIKSEWQRMAENGSETKELADAKTYLTGAYPLRFSSSGRIARMLVGIQIADLPIDYIEKRNGFIEAVTLDDIARVAKKLLDAKRLTFVVVGKPEGVETTE